MSFAFLPHMIVKALPVPVMSVEKMTIQISALFAKGDEVLGVQLQLRVKVKRRYMVRLEPRGCAAPLTFGLVFEMFFLDLVPLRAPKTCRLALDQVVDKFYVSLHLLSVRGNKKGGSRVGADMPP